MGAAMILNLMGSENVLSASNTVLRNRCFTTIRPVLFEIKTGTAKLQ